MTMPCVERPPIQWPPKMKAVALIALFAGCAFPDLHADRDAAVAEVDARSADAEVADEGVDAEAAPPSNLSYGVPVASNAAAAAGHARPRG